MAAAYRSYRRESEREIYERERERERAVKLYVFNYVIIIIIMNSPRLHRGRQLFDEDELKQPIMETFITFTRSFFFF